MPLTRPTRRLLWSSAAALLVAAGLVWKERQDRVNPIIHGQRLNHWVAELDQFPEEREPAPVSFGVSTRLTTPLAADYLGEVPQLAAPRVLAFLQTRNSPTGKFYAWCAQRLPKPMMGLLPRLWVCQHPRRVLEVLAWMRLGQDPALRAELEALWRGPEAGLHELAYRALFANGYHVRRYYPDLIQAAPLLVEGMQGPSPVIQKLALKVMVELQEEHRLTQWPRTLPPLVELLEPLADKSGELAIRFEADGMLRDLGVRRPTAVAVSESGTGGTSSEPSRLFQTVDWQSLNSRASSTLVLPPRADIPGKLTAVKDFGAGFSAESPRYLRE